MEGAEDDDHGLVLGAESMAPKELMVEGEWFDEGRYS